MPEFGGAKRSTIRFIFCPKKNPVWYAQKEDNHNMGQEPGCSILYNDSEICAQAFTNKQLFRHNYEKESIQKLYFMTKSFFLVVFNNQSYFDIYDTDKGELKMRKKFDVNIKFVAASNDAIEFDEDEYHEFRFVIVFSDNHFEFFRFVELEREIGSDTSIILTQLSMVESFGLNCINCHLRHDYLAIFTFSDIVGYLEINFEPTEGPATVKLCINSYVKDIQFQFVYSKNSLLIFKDRKGNLYVFDEKICSKLIKIEGNYDDAVIDECSVLAISGNIVDIYLLHSTSKKNVQCLKRTYLDAHFDKILLMYYEGNSCCFFIIICLFAIYLINFN